MKQIYALVIVLLIGINGCNDDFMDRFPPDKLNDGTFWSTEKDLILYCNRLYPEYIMKSANGKGNWVYSENINSDYVVTNPFQKIPAGIHTIPTNAGDGGWDWVNMRRINYFLARYQKTPVSQEIKNVYAGEILFFKAWDYFDKIKRFGEVPWISSDLGTDSEELMAPRTPRAALLDSVLATIDKAIQYLPEKGKEKTDRINKDMALHLKARMCLFEGTFRKYHTELGLDGTKFLENAADASGRLIQEGHYKIYNTGNIREDYHDVFISMGQFTGEKAREVILQRKFVENILGHNFLRYYNWNNEHKMGGTRALVDLYLCKDGLPISQSPLYRGNDSIQVEFMDRDQRLRQTISYPNEYLWFPEHNGLGVKMPYLPGASSDYGFCETGYWFIKYWSFNVAEKDKGSGANPSGIQAFIIFRYAETLLIHAEAMAELGRCDQAVVDKTINVLRNRVGMAPMQISSLVKDSKSDFPELPVLLDEVRRERTVELAFEFLRRDDLIRWKAGKLYEKKPLGMKFWQYMYPKKDDAGAYTTLVGKNIFVDQDGFLDPHQKQLPGGRIFEEPKHYYFPIPIEDLTLNPNLVQSPGW